VASKLPVDIRDPRVPGGRLAISSGTEDADLRDAYRASILAVLDTDHGPEIVRRLKLTRRKPGALTPEQVHDAVRSFNVRALLEVEAPEQEPVGVQPAMLGETVSRFMRHIQSDQAEGTAIRYARICRQMEAEFGVVRNDSGEVVRDVAVRGISREDVLHWLKRPRKTTGGAPWSPQQQSVAHAVGHQIWAMALVDEEDQAEAGDLPWKPWRNFWSADKQRPKGTVRPAKKQKTRHNFLHRDQAARLLRATKGTRLAAWGAIGFYAGLRVGEVAHLRTEIDIDLEREEIKVQGRKGDYAWRPKGGKPREVPMSRPLARWIRRHVRDGFAGPRYLFHPFGGDRPLHEETARQWTIEAFTAAGIKYGGRTGDALSYHSLRHTFGSWLAMQGISPVAIAELMGNTVEVVLHTYIHLYPGEKKRAVERMRRKLTP
jgi:integrase